MRRILTGALAAGCLLSFSSVASAQNSQIQGFGGVTFGDVANSSTFGGGLAVPLTDNIQIIGEGGRMIDVMPSLVADALDFTPFDVRVSAWYAEGGVRLIGSPEYPIRPYVEATAGTARLTVGFPGAGSVPGIVNSALGFLDSTEPLLGAGGGVVVQGGPVFLDFGYRYKKILAGSSLQSALLGGDVNVNQLRFGVGLRF